MDKAELILYGIATYLAIKTLVSLMSEHRTIYKSKLAAELKANAATAKAAPAGQPGNAAKPQAIGAKAAAKTPNPPAQAKPQVAGKT
jgi:hypothetical protein